MFGSGLGAALKLPATPHNAAITPTKKVRESFFALIRFIEVIRICARILPRFLSYQKPARQQGLVSDHATDLPSLTVGLLPRCAPPIVHTLPECRARAVVARTHECLSILKFDGTMQRGSKMTDDKA